MIIAATSKLELNHIISKASQITELVKEQSRIDVKDSFVIRVFKQDINLRYKKIQRVPFLGNTERSLVLR